MPERNTEEEPLKGGNSAVEVIRMGETVRRPVAPNGEFIHALLKQLEEAGFDATPRFEGIDEQGREILTFMEGEIIHNAQDLKWSDSQLKQAAGLLRDFHNTTAKTALAAGNEVICHNDFAPWNVVLVDGAPSAIIDFDEAAPGTRIQDVSYAAWCWLGLGSEAHTEEEQAAKIKLFCEEYGLTSYSTILNEISQRQKEIRAKHLLSGRAEQAAGVEKDMLWLEQHKNYLNKSIGENMPLTLDKVATEPDTVTKEITLRNGQVLTFRPLMPNDAPALAGFLTGLSNETRKLSTFDGYDEVAAQELCDAINRYDKLRFVLEEKDSKRDVGLVEFSFGLPQSDIERYAQAGIQLNEPTDCRFGPTLSDDYQNVGLGSQILPLVSDIAKRFGKQRIILWGGVLQDNARAIRYYEKNGFKRVGDFTGTAGDKLVDMLLELN